VQALELPDEPWQLVTKPVATAATKIPIKTCFVQTIAPLHRRREPVQRVFSLSFCVARCQDVFRTAPRYRRSGLKKRLRHGGQLDRPEPVERFVKVGPHHRVHSLRGREGLARPGA
jgi:hypothetical protein